MRVALVTGGLPLGGSTSFILFLAAGLKNIAIETEVFSFSAANPLGAQFSSAGIRVHSCDEKRDIYEDRLYFLYQHLRNFDPVVVMSILGIESYEMLRYLPTSVVRIGVILDRAIRPHAFVVRYSATMDHIVVIAHYLIQEAQRSENHPPISHLPLGIPIPDDVAPRNVNPNTPLRLIYYGRLENESKGVHMFPKIALALKRRNIRYTWTIQGNGPEEYYLRRELDTEVRNGAVRFSDPVASELLLSVVRAHDIYLLTSTNEGGPFTLLEAMTLGLVPVCGDIPALVQDVITSENGFRVPQSDPDAYAEAISRLDQDRNLLERMSSMARKTITAAFSQENMARGYAQLFHSLAKPDVARVWRHKIVPISLSQLAPLLSSPMGRSLRRIGKRLRGFPNVKL